MTEESIYHCGYVAIVGRPNVGKSTLMNQMMGEKFSIITSKAQTTRHRILGIVNDEDYQIVFSDTPGVLDPHYKLHQNMMNFVNAALKDGDVILFVTDIYESKMNHEATFERLKKTSIPVILLINKIDQADQAKMEERIDYWAKEMPNAEILPISALEGFNLEPIKKRVLELIPESPPY